MRFDSSPNAFVATAACLAACLCACEANEYDTEAASDASTSQGGNTAAAASSVRASGGRLASTTSSIPSATSGNGGQPTHSESASGTSSMGGSSVTVGAGTSAGASTSTGASSSILALGGAKSTGGATATGGARSTGGATTTGGAKSTGGASATSGVGTSAHVTGVGGTSSTSQANSAGGTNGTRDSNSSSSSPPAAGGGSTPVTNGSGTEFSPYFYTWGWGNSAYAFSGLQELEAKTELKSVTLAFVLSNGQCVATTDIRDHLEDVDAFRNAGGHVKASFGGANGTYLENACTDAQSLAKAISDFVTATNVKDLDFDVEQSPAMDATVNERRARALKQVQTEQGIAVSLTLAATPRDKWGTLGGLSTASLGVVRALLDAQVKLTRVNVMAMDYGAYFSSGNSMGALAISALTDTLTQLKTLIPGLSDAEVWRLLGATPMIGQNDVASEVFSLDDARTLIAFAKEKDLGLVSFWAINRDQPCPYSSLAVCSQVNTRNFEFSEIFASVE